MDWSLIRYFHPDTDRNLRCRHCGKCEMDLDFMLRLDALRHIHGAPIVVNSGYRCPEHNAAVSSSGRNGPHTTGKAVDIRLHGTDVHALIPAIVTLGFTGVGVYQQGPVQSRHIHLDTLTTSRWRPRPWVWSA